MLTGIPHAGVRRGTRYGPTGQGLWEGKFRGGTNPYLCNQSTGKLTPLSSSVSVKTTTVSMSLEHSHICGPSNLFKMHIKIIVY